MPLSNQTLAFIGSGSMAEAIIAGLLRQDALPPRQILTADVRPERLAELHATYGTTPAESNAAAVAAADVIILAVKPQYFAAAAAGLAGRLPAGALALSIMAGTTIETIRTHLAHEPIVRAMPNTPAMIGQGMTAWTATPAVTPTQQAAAEQILAACGQTVQVDGEAQIDMATAINGSGPGYFFLIFEAMVDAGVQLGFSRPVATELVLQTAAGAALYARQSDHHLAELRNQVTSPAGTTAAGLHTLEKGNLRAVLADAITAAHQRAVELGRK